MERDAPLILIVDDNDAGRYGTSRTVRAAGFSVLEAASGAEALEKAALKPDLIVLDIKLPDIDGYEVGRRLNADPATASIPVLHLTAMFLKTQDKIQSLEEGADGFLSQPVHPEELLATIRSLLRIRRAEHERLREIRRWHATFDAIGDPVCVLDGGGRIERWNAAFESFAAAGRERFEGRPFHEAVPEAKENPSLLPLARSLEKRERETVEAECRGRWFHVSVDPVFESGGEVSFVHIMRDITERKRMESEIVTAMENARLLQKEAEAASRAKSSFLATMSHEIRTPLNGVLGFLSLLSETALDEEQREYARHIDSSSKLLLEVISNVLDISKIESERFYLSPERAAIRPLLDRAVALIRPGATEKGLDLVLRVDDNLPECAVFDSARLLQVLGNLLSNALKFTEKGSVELAVSFAHLKGGEGEILFSVRDTGIGMDDEAKERIFEPFYQVDGSNTRKYGGSGLGLPIASTLVRKMGGVMEVESAPGEGSRFFFALRTVCDQRTEERAPSRTAAPAAGGELREAPAILIAEDEPLNRKLLRMLLLKLAPGVKIDEAADGEEAIRLFGRRRPDLVLMDVHMPVKNGFEATLAIRRMEEESGGRTPVVALTADVRPETRAACEEHGMDGWIGKPIDGEIFKLTLEQFLGGGKNEA